MPGKNIIQKQVVEFIVNAPVANAFSLQQEASRWCNETLLPALEKALEKYSPAKETLRLDTLTVAVDTGEPFTATHADQVVSALLAAVEKEAAFAKEQGRLLTNEKTSTEAFFFFLQHGYLPWWSDGKSMAAFYQDLEKGRISLTEAEQLQLKQILSEEGTIKRVVTALSPAALAQLISDVLGISDKKVKAFLEEIHSLSRLIKNGDLQYLFVQKAKEELIGRMLSTPHKNLLPLHEGIAMIQEHLRTNEISFSLILLQELLQNYHVPVEQLVQHLNKQHSLSIEDANAVIAAIESQTTRIETGFPTVDQDSLTSAGARNEDSKKENRNKRRQQNLRKSEGIYLNNAGLVLLAPFLPRFFANLGIVEEGRFNSKDLAIALQQWLVTGQEEYAEFDTALPKIFCGMEPEDLISVIPQLPETFKQEGEALLQAVIKNWDIIKNTSVEGLRQSFLQREGKLSFGNHEWLLQVEQKGYDVLLKELPWTIHLIKLPWMKHLLRTEWI